MALNTDKIDDYTLALLYLVTWDREEGLGASRRGRASIGTR